MPKRAHKVPVKRPSDEIRAESVIDLRRVAGVQARIITEFVKDVKELEKQAEKIECNCQYSGAIFTHVAIRGLMKRFGMIPQDEELPCSGRETDILCDGEHEHEVGGETGL